MASAQPGYVMGHTDHERRRLALQAAVLNPFTDTFLRRAGISAGMRVLELGCGIGEVSLIAARLVGPHGYVHCIDIDPAALEIARARARSAGHDYVVFEQIDIKNHQPARLCDAVIGRHILIHTPDPLAVLRQAVTMVHNGGVIAFQEYDLSYSNRSYPEVPLAEFASGLIVGFFRRCVPYANMGTQLFHLMQEAGLPPPECRAEYLMDGSPNSPGYEWMAETVRSLLPRLQALGLTTAAEVAIDTLAQRLRQQTMERHAVIVTSTLVSAFARKRDDN